MLLAVSLLVGTRLGVPPARGPPAGSWHPESLASPLSCSNSRGFTWPLWRRMVSPSGPTFIDPFYKCCSGPSAFTRRAPSVDVMLAGAHGSPRRKFLAQTGSPGCHTSREGRSTGEGGMDTALSSLERKS